MQSENTLNETIWDPLHIFQCPADYKFAIVVLNQPILLHHDYVLPLWEKGNYHCCYSCLNKYGIPLLIQD